MPNGASSPRARGEVRGERFPKSLRIVRRRDFDTVREKGRTLRDPLLRVGWLARGDGPTRIGLAVSSRVGNAVRRNRIKRLLREAFRRRRALFPPGLDLVLIPQDGAKASEYAAVAEALERIAAKLTRQLAAGRSEAPRPPADAAPPDEGRGT